jgi:ACT domain-containing protein
MRKLLAMKLKTAKFISSIHGTLSEVIEQAAQEAVEISTSHLKLSLNNVEHAGTTLYAKLMFVSNELLEEYSKVRASHNI